MIEHWDGTAWHMTRSDFALLGVRALAKNDVYTAGSGRGPSVRHFDGKAWSDVVSPTPQVTGLFYAIDAVSPKNLFAVGWQVSTQQNSLAEHAVRAK